jgi:outer membrane lipoprotein-sorting protein
MPHQRSRRAVHAPALLLFTACVAAVACASIVRAQSPASKNALRQGSGQAFDELYQRGQKANGGLKTLTARFTETTTSPLLTRPLVARGTLALQRPSTVVLRYDAPEARTVLIDDKRLLLSWPGRNIYQTRNIGQMQSRIQKYFVEGNPDELRKSFDITVTDAEQRAGTDHVVLVPKRKQIREGLTLLDLWIDHSSLLLTAMRMTFAGGETKLMTLEDVVPNAPIAPGTFAHPPQTTR